MKKVLLLIALMGLILITVSCQKPEEVTLSKYFQAMKAGDRDTMAAMANDPIQIQFNDWKLVSSEPPVEANIAISEMANKLNELKRQKAEQSMKAADKFAIRKEAEDKMKGSKRVPAGIQKQYDDANAAFEAEKKILDQISLEYNTLKAKLEVEKKLFTLSTSIEREQEMFTGKTQEVNALVNVQSDSGAKDYVFTLRKYILDQPGSDRKQSGRFVIVNITAKE